MTTSALTRENVDTVDLRGPVDACLSLEVKCGGIYRVNVESVLKRWLQWMAKRDSDSTS